MSPTVLKVGLVALLRQTFGLDWHGIHGAPHWARVRLNGLSLAPHTGANPEVVEWFAFLHDIRRLDDGHDEHHGARAAEFAATLRGEWIHLSAPDFDRLHYACQGHFNFAHPWQSKFPHPVGIGCRPVTGPGRP